jgi:hypothetical protein
MVVTLRMSLALYDMPAPRLTGVTEIDRPLQRVSRRPPGAYI